MKKINTNCLFHVDWSTIFNSKQRRVQKTNLSTLFCDSHKLLDSLYSLSVQLLVWRFIQVFFF